MGFTNNLNDYMTMTRSSFAVSVICILSLSVGARAQVLSGSVTQPAGTQNLTVLGTADWAHWGLYSGASFDHKAGVTSQIGNYTVINAEMGAVASYTANAIGYTWADGTPDSAISGTTSGIYINGLNHGFQITSPADTMTRTLTVYLGVYNGRGSLVAHLSDGSAPDFVDNSLNGSGSQNGAYTLQYAAPSSGQSLFVTWTLSSGSGNVNLQSATLEVGGNSSPSPDFTTAVLPPQQTGFPGGTESFIVNIASVNGFSGAVGLAVSGTPQGATSVFNPATILNGAGSSTLTITIPVGTTPASYPLTFTETSGQLIHSASATLQVNGPPDFSVALQPPGQTVITGSSTSFTTTVTPQNGFTGAVALTAGGLPPGSSVSFAPATIPAGSGSSSITITTASNTPAGVSTISVTGTSGNLTHTAAASVTVNVPGGGSLTGTTTPANGTQNLTTLGSSDWAHWGLNSSASYDHKSSGGSQISNFTVVNGQAPSVASFSGSALSYSWSDGAPDASVGSTSSGVYIAGVGRGFQFAAPADTNSRTMIVYLGVFAGEGRFTAHLSDGSAADFLDTSVSSGAAAYTVQYQAASSGQTLTLTWTLLSGSGNVNLQAAVLSTSPSADFSVSVQPATTVASPGGTASDTISITPRNGFIDQVTLSASGLPANSTATFTPTTISGGSGSSTLSISVAANTQANTYPLTITAAANALIRTQTLALQVTGPPDFTLTAQPALQAIRAGMTATYPVSIGSLNGFSASVNLSITGLPGDALYTFTPSIIVAGSGSASLTVQIPASEATGNYSPVITATSGVISQTANIVLQITGQDFGLTVLPATQSVPSGTSATFSISIAPQNGFTGSVALAVAGVPTAGVATFTPSSIANGTGSSSLVVSVPQNTATKGYVLTVTASSGSISHSTAATLQVAGPQDFYLSLRQVFQSLTGNGGTASYAIATSPSSSYTGLVDLSVTGLPPGAAATWNPQTISGASGSAIVTVTAPGGLVAGSYPLSFTAMGTGLTHTAKGVLLITPLGGNTGPVLNGNVSAPAASQNLTALGTSDWAHWGLLSSTSFDHKAGITPEISNVTVVDGEAGSVGGYSGNPVGYSWSGGVPDATANTATGIYIGGVNRGFEISVPADTNPRTVTLFVGVFSGQGKLVAHLSDGSAPDFVDTSLSSGGSQLGEYTIQYAAAGAGETLTLAWTMARGGGNVNIQAAALALAAAAPTGTPQFYVSPAGTPAGDGSIGLPWDIVTALNQPAAVTPGATIWLRGGTYPSRITQFSSYLAGTATQPIIVREYPGERATIDGGIAIYGPNTWYWGFEVFNSSIDRGSGAARLECIDTYAGSTGVKLINLALHDCLQGLGFWVGAVNGEANGNLIYYNGEYSLARGVGHGIYTQNNTGIKQLIDNIVFEQFDIGLQAFGSPAAYVQGYALDGNVTFNNGQLYGALTDNILFGGSGTLDQLDNVSVQNTYAYSTPSLNQAESQLGWQFDGQNGSVSSQNNFWIGGNVALELWNWTNATFTGNTLYSPASLDLLVNTNGGATAGYSVDNNAYYGSMLFNLNGSSMANSTWLSTSGFDAHSTFTPGRPAGVWTFIRPNGYEAGRANVIIYNWDLDPSVSMDLTGILNTGDSYVIRDAENYFAAPIASGTWTAGVSIAIPMTGLTPAPTVGTTNAPPVHTAPEFGVFVVSRQ